MKAKDKTFYPSISIYRGYPWSTSLTLKALGPDKQISADLIAQTWFNSFFNIQGTLLKPGLELEINKHISSTQYKYDIYNLSFLYRMQSTLQMEGDSWGFRIPVGVLQSETQSSSLVGIGLFLDSTIPYFLSWGGERSAARADYLTSSDSAFGNSILRFQYHLNYSFSNQSFLEYGLGGVQIGSQFEPDIHFGWKFRY